MIIIASVLGTVAYCVVVGAVHQILITDDPDAEDLAMAIALCWIIALPMLAAGTVAIKISGVGAKAAERLTAPKAKLLSPKELLKRYPRD